MLVKGAVLTPCAREKKPLNLQSIWAAETIPQPGDKAALWRPVWRRSHLNVAARTSANSSWVYGLLDPAEASGTAICFSSLGTQRSLWGQQPHIQRSIFYLLSQFSGQLEVKQLPHFSCTPNSLLVEFTSALLQLYSICIIKMSAKEAKKNSFLFRGSSVVKMMS